MLLFKPTSKSGEIDSFYLGGTYVKFRSLQSVFSILQSKIICSNKKPVKIASLTLFLILFMGCFSYLSAYDIRTPEAIIIAPSILQSELSS